MPRQPQPTFDVAPEHRSYVHLKCGQITVVDGDDFEGLCCPFTGLFGVTTYCVHCQAQDSLDKFAWLDTKESLGAYRRRMRTAVSPIYYAFGRLMPWLYVVVAPAFAAYGAVRLLPSHPIIAGVIAFVAAAFVGMIVFGAFLNMPVNDFRKYR
jgi:hypothetical protein